MSANDNFTYTGQVATSVTVVDSKAIRAYNSQYESEKLEMQHLNDRLGEHLNRVRRLEDDNLRLKNHLDGLKMRWGFDSGQVKSGYDEDLRALRKEIDDLSNRNAIDQIASKRAESDAIDLQHAIDFEKQLLVKDQDRLIRLKQELEISELELSSIIDRDQDKRRELERGRNDVERLRATIKGLKDRLDQASAERVHVENQYQTIEEQIAFIKAIHEAERNELVELGASPLNDQLFYQSELSRVINLIKTDFENLAQEQRRELDDYYRIKKDEFLRQVAERDAQEQRSITPKFAEPIDLSTIEQEYQREREEVERVNRNNEELKTRIRDLEQKYNDDLIQIRDEEQAFQDQYARQLSDLQTTRQQINSVVEGNVSLRSEINTYRRLLELEEKHGVGPKRTEEPRPPEPPVEQNRTMTVQRSSQGSINIDQIDPEGKFIVLENTGTNSKDQPMSGWTLRRKFDGNQEMVYRFPNSFVLRSRDYVRVVTNTVSQLEMNQKNTLVANELPSWGGGRQNQTSLYDSRGVQKAVLKQNFM